MSLMSFNFRFQIQMAQDVSRVYIFTFSLDISYRIIITCREKLVDEEEGGLTMAVSYEHILLFCLVSRLIFHFLSL